MNNQQEIWKDIPNYEGIYQVSNLGNVKRLPGKKFNRFAFIELPQQQMCLNLHRCGYYKLSLSKDGIRKVHFVHRLVMQAFCGLSNLQVDHINGIKTDNRLENLRYVSNRENCTHHHIMKKTFKGYSFDKRKNKYFAQIWHNNKHRFLGYFNTPELAKQTYLNYIKENNL